MSSQQEFQAPRLNRSSTTSSVTSGYSSDGWLELTHTPRDDASSISSTSTGFLPLTAAVSRPAGNVQPNVTDEERRLFLLRARNN
ncbi:hypothetical protein GLAREA_05855 [Glarea lozoyensis ATCC 20868]|uniref:Uncharacterized protein n=1 Tax=Glarea lozoyensis (strain ATCC 20868 / MF5171) TaxID=1116229 RepID=S3E349_GLAL2|nr:uncharacterized protein GLAREA_05855 [Glarea lozoyensis ATCC 20868]EPE32843.1 hypothetical protein GLAREA_05855 [Glarea lozoyensis ATCC 20868]